MYKTKANKKTKKKARKTTLILFIILCLLTIFFILLTQTDYFIIKEIDVKGNKNLTNDNIIKASGTNISDNILKISKREVEENLVSHPYIKSARVIRKLPDKLTIEIMERKEVAVVPYIGSYLYIDKEGIILKTSQKKDESGLPELIGLDINKPKVKEKLSTKNYNIDKIVNFVQLVNKLPMVAKTGVIDFSNAEAISMTNDGIKVDFGPLNNVKYKLEFLNSILEDIKEKEIKCKYIYFNKGDNPIIVTDSNY